jgi:hypothetical protein
MPKEISGETIPKGILFNPEEQERVIRELTPEEKEWIREGGAALKTFLRESKKARFCLDGLVEEIRGMMAELNK